MVKKVLLVVVLLAVSWSAPVMARATHVGLKSKRAEMWLTYSFMVAQDPNTATQLMQFNAMHIEACGTALTVDEAIHHPALRLYEHYIAKDKRFDKTLYAALCSDRDAKR